MAKALQPKVFVTGRVAVETDGGVIEEAQLGGRQARLVFAYLVAERSRPVPRDELAEALWGETPPVTRDKALTVIASRLRAALADAGLDGRELLTAAFGCYRLDLPEGTWVDLFAAASSAQDAEDALAAGEFDQARTAAESAQSLARRPFLPGEDGTWVEQKRRDLADIRERALSVLADACLRSGAAREAAKWAEELIALSPFREAGYRRLMEAHAAAGDRAEALRVYDQCRRLLADELGAYPSPETESIYRELLATPAPGNGAVTGDAERLKDADRPESAARVVGVPSASAPPRGIKPERSRAVRRRTVLGAALTGVIAVAVLVPLVGLSSRGSRTPEPTLGGNDVGAVSASTGHILASAPLAGLPDAITAGDGSIWAAMPDRGIVSDRHDDERGAADDPDTRPRWALVPHVRRRVHLGRRHVRQHRLPDRPAGQRRPARRQPDPRRERPDGDRLRARRRLGRKLGRPHRHPDQPRERNRRPADLRRRRGGRRRRGRPQRLGNRPVERRSLTDRPVGANSCRHDARRRPDSRRDRTRRGVDRERSERDGVQDRPVERRPGGGLPGRWAAERNRRRSRRPRLGCQRPLGDQI